MGKSLKPAQPSLEDSIEKTLREASGREDKAVKLFLKPGKKGSSNKYGKVLYCEEDAIYFIQGTNGKNHKGYDMIPFARISKVKVFTEEKSIERKY